MSRVTLAVFAGLALMLLVAGCASVEPDQFAALNSQVMRNKDRIAKLEAEQANTRKPQAEIQADMVAMRQELAALRGQVEEMGYRLGQVPDNQQLAQSRDQVDAEKKELLDRIARLEKYLELDKKKAAAAKAAQPKAPESAKDIYDLAMSLRKKKSYDAARDRFQEVLDKHPKSSLADNAQYWIGDTYYDQKRYEEAILAFNQVVKRYPKSGKVPAALLKQGLAFNRLGDKRTAKIVLKRLVTSYPKSDPAKTARRVLKQL